MNCSFCGCEIPRGTETIFVTKRGKALYFCSGKCEINMLKLERKARETKWTREYLEEKEIRIKAAPPAPAPKPKKEEKPEAHEEPVKEEKAEKKKEAPKKKAKPAHKETKKAAKKKK